MECGLAGPSGGGALTRLCLSDLGPFEVDTWVRQERVKKVAELESWRKAGDGQWKISGALNG